MSYTIHCAVTTDVSTASGPLPGATITWAGNNAGVVTGSDGTASGTVDGNDENTVSCTAFKPTYKSQTLAGSIKNTSANPLQFTLQGQGCLIVSAATGSADSAEVRRMQQIRARIAALSALAGQLIAEILSEYYQFSPGIAVHLDRDEVARGAVLEIAVRPLMAWYALAVNLGLDPVDPKTVESRVQDVLNACAAEPGNFSIAALLEAIRSGGPLPEGSPKALLPFLDRANEVARSHFASWAILDPLMRLWTLRTRQADLIDEVCQWLGSAPLETLPRAENLDALDQDLKTLSGFFDFRPTARRQIGIRLASVWPEAVPALIKNGFLA
jgi:hypothetical protein